MTANKPLRIMYADDPATIPALLEDYEALQVECEKLRKDAERYRYIRRGGHWIVAATQTGAQLGGENLDELIDDEIADAMAM